MTDEEDYNLGWVFKTSIYEHRLHVNSVYTFIISLTSFLCNDLIFFVYAFNFLVISETPFNFVMNDTRFTTLSWFQTVF